MRQSLRATWLALGAIALWVTYSLMTQRVAAFHTAAIGNFGFVSGILALLCHFLMETPVALSWNDIGLLSFLTPLCSTLLLLLIDRQEVLTSLVAWAGVLIVGGAWLGRPQNVT